MRRKLLASLFLLASMVFVGCSGDLEYIPAASLMVGRAGGNTTLELKLERDDAWDRVSRCIWKIDSIQAENEGRRISISLDREVSHAISCTLYVGDNLWSCFIGHCPKANWHETDEGGIDVWIESVGLS